MAHPWNSSLIALQLVAAGCALLASCQRDDSAAGAGDSGNASVPGAPVAEISAFPTRGYVPLTVRFDGSASHDDDGAVVGHSWDLDGDGSADLEGEDGGFEYADSGTWTASLEVTDNEGKTDVAEVEITVLPDEEVVLLDEQFDSDPFSDGRWAVYLEDCAETRDGTVEYRSEEDGCGGAGGYITRESSYRCVVYGGSSFSTEGYHDVELDFWGRYDDGVVRVDAIANDAWVTVSDVETSADWTQRSVTPEGDITGLRVLLRDGAVDCISLIALPICRPDEARACAGGATTFSVSAFGGEAFQWQRDGADLADGGHLWGVTEPMLVIDDASAEDEGSYRCAITTSGGTVLSNPGTLSVEDAPTISQQPSSSEVSSGESLSLSVEVLGVEPITYRWQKDGEDLAEGSRIAGTATAELTISAAEPGDQGSYRVLVADDCGEQTSSADAQVYVRSWDAEAPLVTGSSVDIDLHYESDWIIEADFLGCDTDGGFDRYLQEEDRLDLFNRGSDMLALRLANRQIWFESANLGSVSTAIGETDHFGETLAANIEQGDHSIRIEYMGTGAQARLYWDGALIGDWNLWIESVPGAMGDVAVTNMEGGTIRWYQGSFVSLADL